jgi:hypothetical protein
MWRKWRHDTDHVFLCTSACCTLFPAGTSSSHMDLTQIQKCVRDFLHLHFYALVCTAPVCTAPVCTAPVRTALTAEWVFVVSVFVFVSTAFPSSSVYWDKHINICQEICLVWTLLNWPIFVLHKRLWNRVTNKSVTFCVLDLCEMHSSVCIYHVM